MVIEQARFPVEGRNFEMNISLPDGKKSAITSRLLLYQSIRFVQNIGFSQRKVQFADQFFFSWC